MFQSALIAKVFLTRHNQACDFGREKFQSALIAKVFLTRVGAWRRWRSNPLFQSALIAKVFLTFLEFLGVVIE